VKISGAPTDDATPYALLPRAKMALKERRLLGTLGAFSAQVVKFSVTVMQMPLATEPGQILLYPPVVLLGMLIGA
jgi:hypothetical protein